MKSFIVLVFMIFTLTGFTKAEGWTNAGEFSYLYPNGNKQITDYTLTEDGKSIVVITTEGNNTFRLNKFNLETGVSEFDTLFTTKESHKFSLSNDGLTVFDIEEKSVPGFGFFTSYKLFDILHSSKGYIYQDTLITDDASDQYESYNVHINKINFQYNSGLIYLGTTRSIKNYNNHFSEINAKTLGEFYIFDVTSPNTGYQTKKGATSIFDSYQGTKFISYNENNKNSGSQGNFETYKLKFVESNKTDAEIMNLKSGESLDFVNFINNSYLMIQLLYRNKHSLHYYNFRTGQFTDTTIFQAITNKHGFHIGYSNDGKYFVKSDNNKLEFYKHFFKFQIYSINLPDTLNSIGNYSFSGNDAYIVTVNNSKQIVRFKNPLVENQVNVYFVLSDTAIVANKQYKCYNLTTGNPTKYTWDFNNGTTSSEFEPEIKFDEPGFYIIKLTAEKYGESYSYEKIINVLPNFYAGFEIVNIPNYLPMNCKFRNTSTTNIDSLIWDFGDGTFSRSKDTIIYHIFAKDNDYNVKLKVFYKTLVDSAEKMISIDGIADLPFEPGTYTEYPFVNLTNNHHKICKIFHTDDDGYILIEQRSDTTTLLKTADNLIPYKSVILNKPLNCPAENLDELYFNNFLKFDEKNYIFYSQSDNNLSTISIFDKNLNKTTETNAINANFHLIAFPNDIPDSNIIVFESIGTAGYKNKYNVFTGTKIDSENLGDRFYLMNDTMDVVSLLSYHFAYAPISNTYSNISSFKLRNPKNGNFIYEDVIKSNSKLKKQIPFNVLRNIDDNSFVGLDTRGYVLLFNANGDSLNNVKLTTGLRNIAINGSRYYALGSKSNHPICYVFDEDLIMKDTIYIENRDGAFLDAVLLDNGDLLLGGYRLLPSKTELTGKLIRNSYILKINSKILGKKDNNVCHISITNPINHFATIRFAVDKSTTFHYEAYDFLGHQVFKTAEQKIDSDYTGQVDFSGLAPGVYIFKFYINGKIVTKKVIYQK